MDTLGGHRKIGEAARPEVTEAIRVIMDTFAGADGGVSFYRFCQMLNILDEQAIKGDDAARRLVDIVLQFRKLIAEAQRLPMDWKPGKD